jgi:hypothetical protein
MIAIDIMLYLLGFLGTNHRTNHIINVQLKGLSYQIFQIFK